ncbi:MAG: 2Fe-2S iron-sulfur cluster binding domain-containing protein, partial [Desulfobacteraceae bacterium]|nr:2Fe-2S iron-sulfur cluster binding domain-containing protein [Desulfobacteraceae bacterium]
MKHNVYLCEECLRCRDPEIYCKFRSACPIWFMDKEQRRREAEARAGEERRKQSVQVTFRPGDRQALVIPGATLLDAAQQAGIQLNASCGGKGSCGKCKLVVESGGTEHPTTPLLTDTEKKKGTVLACQSRVVEDTVVRIPEETLERKLKVAGMGAEVTGRLQGLVPQVEPMLLDLPLELSPPTLQDPVSDLDRL